MLNAITTGPDAAWPLIRRLLTEDGRRHLPGYGLAFVFMAIVAATTAGSAYIMETVINEIFVNRDPQMVWIISGVVLALFVVKGAAAYGQQVTLARIGNGIVASIQRRIYRHVLAQDLAFFQRTPMSDLITRMSHNAAATRRTLDLVITSLGRDFLTMVALIVVMVVQDPQLSMIALLIAPPAIWGVSRLMKRIKGLAQAEYAYLTHIVSAMQETALGVRVVKAFNLEDHMRARMNEAIENVRGRADKIAAINARTSPLMETLGGFAIAGVILYGGFSVVKQGTEPGAFFSFITALLLAYDPAKRLAKLNVQLRQALVGVGLMYDLIDTEPALREAPEAFALKVSEGRIALKDVSFAYSDIPALHQVSLEAKPGRVTALVGPSGAGKSTVFNLIERFSDPGSGVIEIDGQGIMGATLRSLREQIAFVSQDTFLFDGTVAENISYGKLDASREDIEAAARNANAHDFILAMRGGYDAPVGEGGGNLSGGQRQRIAIARAMLRDAPILLLDEATSALDAEAEAKVQDALERLMRGRTTLVIAHRLSTVRGADIIHVMDQGRLAQSGSHEALIAEGGLYAHLHALQFRDDAAV